jgi:hypothetical protein
MTGDLMKPNHLTLFYLRATIVFLQKLSTQAKLTQLCQQPDELNKQSFFPTVIESIYRRKSFASETGIASVSSIARELVKFYRSN